MQNQYCKMLYAVCTTKTPLVPMFDPHIAAIVQDDKELANAVLKVLIEKHGECFCFIRACPTRPGEAEPAMAKLVPGWDETEYLKVCQTEIDEIYKMMRQQTMHHD